MERGRKILFEELNNKFIKDDIHYILNSVFENPKSAQASEEARKKGNALLLLQKKHDAESHKAIFRHYCESIALAPSGSQKLAVAYGNRSYILLHMHKYEDCIKDIDRALEISNSDLFKTKLLCRKVECLKRLGSSNVSSILEMIQNLVEKVNGQDRIKLLKMIDTVKGLAVNTKKVEMSSNKKERIKDHELPVTDDYSSCVSIDYSEKYGRHLIAAKDYKPGDIIFIEKMYASAFVDGSSLLGCDHCLQQTWTSIPCEQCNWSMYCSNSCKEEAWNKYHDIECSLISHLKQCSDLAWKPNVMVVRILIIAIKEAGSVANLKEKLELINRGADGSAKDFFKNDQFGMNNFQNVNSLASYIPYDALVRISTIVPLILISLTKYSNLKNNFNVQQMEDLEKNEDIIFVGSLLIKIIALLSCNAFASTYDEFVCTLKQSEVVYSDERRCLGIMFSLLNHSCFPSANWCCTEQNKILVFTLQPIKKNSQIFIAYRYGFENEIQSIRQAKFIRKYNFTCDCRACVEAWRPIKMAGDKDANKKEVDVVNDMRKEKISNEDLQEVTNAISIGQLDKSHIEKLSLLITRGIHWKQPSHMFCNLINFLKESFVSIYSPKSLLFDKCD